MILGGLGRSLAAGFALAAIGSGVITCSDRPSSPGTPSGPTCAPLQYISGDACVPLQIGAPAKDAQAADESSDVGTDDGGSDADGSGSAATPGQDGADAQDDAPPDLDAFVPISGLDFDALDLDVDCGGDTPVPVCVEYFAYFTWCLQRDELSEACQSSLLESQDADLQSIWQLCNDNLQRLQAACR